MTLRIFKLLLFLVLLQNTCFAQNTESQIKVFQTKLDRINFLLNKDSLQKAQDEILAIKEDLPKFKAFEEASVFAVKVQLDLEKKNHLNNVNRLELQISDLENKLKAAKDGNTNEVLKVVEGMLDNKYKQQSTIDGLNKEKTTLVSKQNELIDYNTQLQVKLAKTEKEYESSISELNKYKAAIKIGLSMGYNTFWHNQKEYVVQQDSTIKEIGNGYGASGIISGVVTVRLNSADSAIKHHVVFNVPLGDFTNSSERAIGLFNSRTAVGLGYSISPFKDVPYLSFGAIFNMSPYERIDYNSIKHRKVDLPEFTKLEPADFGATSDINYSFTIGIIYSFINVGFKK